MRTSIGVVGAGQFAASFFPLFRNHPGVDRLFVTDLEPSRAEHAATTFGLDGAFATFDELLESDCASVAIFTQRWTHAPLVLRALRAGKNVYSAVPMGVSYDELAAIIEAVRATNLTYMMGETSFYYPAAVYARQRYEAGDFGRLFYAEGDYVHDMDLGFYDAYRYSGGERWKETASYPPMLYPTHAIGGVLSVLPEHAVSVSCLAVRDERGDGVFDRSVSMFDNDFSNASALFELSGGSIMRTNEMRRVGYPSHIRESRYRYFGTEASFEQLVDVSVWQDKKGFTDVSRSWNRPGRTAGQPKRATPKYTIPAGCQSLTRAYRLATKVHTISWPMISCVPSPSAACHRSTRGWRRATPCLGSSPTNPPSGGASAWSSPTLATHRPRHQSANAREAA